MIINIKIPDSLYERYLLKYGAPLHYSMMKKALEEFQDIPTGDRWFGVHGKDRQRIEAIFQCTINSAAELATNLEKLNRVNIGGIDMTFDPEELARIDMQATFHGRDRLTFIKEMVQEIKDRMLEKV